jgi:hypothetical protein
VFIHIDGAMPVKYGLRVLSSVTARVDNQQSAASADRFLVVLSFAAWHTHVAQGADHASRCRSDAGSCQRRSDGTCRHNRPDSRNRNRSQTNEKPGEASGGGTLCGVRPQVARALSHIGILAGTVIRYEVQMLAREAGAFQISKRCLRFIAVAE